MRDYVQETARRWSEFQSSHQEVSTEIKELMLGICTDMTSTGRKRQIEAMQASDEYNKLRTLVLRYGEALGIRENTDRELALWIRTVCFCDIMRAERAA